MKSFGHDLVVTCGKILDIPKTTSINPNNKAIYWFIAAVLLAIEPLLLLVAIVIKYCIKRELKIPCLL